MDIFISWSGPRSRAVAEALKEYLPMIVNAFNPWLSCADIDKGARWNTELSTALATAKAGIVCLTPNNLTAPYILFEAGAVSKAVDKSYVCTLLIGMEPSDVSGPLAQFQATKLNKSELLHLLKNLNKAMENSAVKEQQLEKAFDLCWPKLSESLQNLPSDGPTARPERSERELLEELIDLARSSRMELGELNVHVVERLERSSAVTQAQIDYLLQMMTPPSTLWDTETPQKLDNLEALRELGKDERETPRANLGRVLRGLRGVSRNAAANRVKNIPPESESKK